MQSNDLEKIDGRCKLHTQIQIVSQLKGRKLDNVESRLIFPFASSTYLLALRKSRALFHENTFPEYRVIASM